MKQRVLEELGRIEREHGVRVLLAVESGSRAWGFASPDSDYDVRFVYAHPCDWYVSVEEPRDVIEEMLPGDLDVSGWDLRKTLRLFSKCNLALNEWLGSPIIYAEALGFREQLLHLLPGFFNPLAGIHHYRSMASRALEDAPQGDGIRIKKLFYVLRPLFACRWIERRRSQPPTLFADLVAAELVSAEERGWIDNLCKRKAAAGEADLVTLEPQRGEAIRAELERFRSMSVPLNAPRTGSKAELDELLRAWTSK